MDDELTISLKLISKEKEMRKVKMLVGVWIGLVVFFVSSVFAQSWEMPKAKVKKSHPVSGWVTAKGAPKKICEAVRGEPTVKLGPNGYIETIFPEPKCEMVYTGRSPLFALLTVKQNGRGEEMKDSQQTIPEGAPCIFPEGSIKIKDVVYGMVEGVENLWAACVREK